MGGYSKISFLYGDAVVFSASCNDQCDIDRSEEAGFVNRQTALPFKAFFGTKRQGAADRRASADSGLSVTVCCTAGSALRSIFEKEGTEAQEGVCVNESGRQ